MKCPKDLEFSVLYAVSLRVSQLEKQYDTILEHCTGYNDYRLLKFIFSELTELKSFLKLNDYPTF